MHSPDKLTSTARSVHGTDYYERLGLPRYAAIADVRKAYRRLAAQYHPDRFAAGVDVHDTSDVFCAITGAYEVIGDEQKKSDYDAQLRRSVMCVEDAGDSLEAIQRDRERLRETSSRAKRVTLSAYGPGDAVLQQMREAIHQEETSRKVDGGSPSSTASLYTANTSHFQDSRNFITQSAVDEIIRHRIEQDTQRQELYADLDRLHVEAERERERRRRERQEKRLQPSVAASSAHERSTSSSTRHNRGGEDVLDNPHGMHELLEGRGRLAQEEADARTAIVSNETSDNGELFVKYSQSYAAFGLVVPSQAELDAMQRDGKHAQLEFLRTILQQKLWYISSLVHNKS